MANQLFNKLSMSYLDDQNRPKDKNRSLRVIGAGFSRTGTLSFTMAIERLLNGPVCHGGTACLNREEEFIKGWISICNPKPPNTSEAYVIRTLQELLEGYVGTADVPCFLFTEELCKAFPDAVVICTTRDKEKWWKSIKPVADATAPWWLAIVFQSRSTLRYYGEWLKSLGVRAELNYGARYGKLKPDTIEKHIEHIKRVTPPEKLHFFNVKDGWEPLCKILNVPIPDEPFPHANDGEQVQKEIMSLIIRGLIGWLQVFGVLAGIAILGVFVWRNEHARTHALTRDREL